MGIEAPLLEKRKGSRRPKAHESQKNDCPQSRVSPKSLDPETERQGPSCRMLVSSSSGRTTSSLGTCRSLGVFAWARLAKRNMVKGEVTGEGLRLLGGQGPWLWSGFFYFRI